VFFWSTLPISLKISLDAVDALSLTWLRFLTAAVFTLALLLWRKRLSQFAELNINQWLWLLCAAVMLVANYLLFLYGLEMTSPANAQVFIQLAPLLMTLGGVLVFKEHFTRIQLIGSMSVLLGLALFFSDQLEQTISSQFNNGILIIMAAAVTWAIYALIQKKLSQVLSSQAILAFIYLFASIVLVFNVNTASFTGLNTTQWLAIGYACINTIGAYGAFAESLNHWNASRVGMVLAITPVATLLFINLFASYFPELIGSESIYSIGWFGIGFIVMGSILASFKKSLIPTQKTRL